MKHELETERKRLEKAVHKRIKRLKKSLLIKEEELLECKKKELYEQMGNLLACHFQALKPGMSEITVQDLYHDDTMVTIPLESKKSPKQNVSVYFNKVKKLIKRAEVLPPVIQKMEGDLQAWIALLSAIKSSESLDELHDIKEREHLLESPKEKEAIAQKRPFHVFVSQSGLTLLVGKDAESNDFLTFQKASGEDIWLHAHGCPGSHVIIRTGGEREVDRQTLLDAMQLALYFSKRRAQIHQRHEVVWCLRRYVAKRRGAPKGEVVVSGGKLECVELDPSHIAKIKVQK